MWERESNWLIFAARQDRLNGFGEEAFVRVARYDIMLVESHETGSFHQISRALTHKASVKGYGY
jgi:hypothetical protein